MCKCRRRGEERGEEGGENWLSVTVGKSEDVGKVTGHLPTDNSPADNSPTDNSPNGQFARGQFARGQFAHNYCFFVKIYEFMDQVTISTLHYVKIIKNMKVEKRNKQII